MSKEIDLHNNQLLPEHFANVAGQLSPSSQRIYQHDAITFATWLNENNYGLTRESVILYRQYLSQKYRPTTAKRIWSVVCRILDEQVRSEHLDKNPTDGVISRKRFKAYLSLKRSSTYSTGYCRYTE